MGGHHKRGTRGHARMHGSNFARTHIPASLWPVGHISRYIMRENTTGEAPTHVLVSWVVGVGGHRRGVLRERAILIATLSTRVHHCFYTDGGTHTDALYSRVAQDIRTQLCGGCCHEPREENSSMRFSYKSTTVGCHGQGSASGACAKASKLLE